MIRDKRGDSNYWDSSCQFGENVICNMLQKIQMPSENPGYRPQYLFELAKENLELLFSCYSKGDSINELAQYFPPLLDAWEESERLGAEVWTEEQQYTRHSWRVNLDHYIVCFWLVGLALALEIPDPQWQRLLVLIGNEGEDALLDKVIATRQPDRKIGKTLCFPRPYQRLLNAITAAPDKQATQLASFVEHWFKELKQKKPKADAAHKPLYDRPYWYILGDRQLHDSGYFGRWCVEAVAVVKAFGLDDSLCLGHNHYPGDLLRPNGPSTHPARDDSPASPEPETILSQPKQGWLARLFSRK